MSTRELDLEDAEIQERVALLTQHTNQIPARSHEFANSLLKGYAPVCAEHYNLHWGKTIRETEVTP